LIKDNQGCTVAELLEQIGTRKKEEERFFYRHGLEWFKIAGSCDPSHFQMPPDEYHCLTCAITDFVQLEKSNKKVFPAQAAIDTFLKQGIDVNGLCKRTYLHPLQAAVPAIPTKETNALACRLLERGSSANVQDYWKRTLLHTIDDDNNSTEWTEEMNTAMHLLLKYKTDPNVVDTYGRNPLYAVVSNLIMHTSYEIKDEKYFEIIKTLIEHGADPYFVNEEDGNTVFHLLHHFYHYQHATYVCNLLIHNKQYNAEKVRACLAVRNDSRRTAVQTKGTMHQDAQEWRKISDMLMKYE
jgi:hypothetical protein